MSANGHAHGSIMLEERVLAFARSRQQAFTPMRRRVLATLTGAAAPLSAYQIADILSADKRVAAVQVYRALDFLQEAGAVHRLASRAAFFACDHVHAEGETVVFMVCNQCGVVQEGQAPLVGEGLQSAAAATGFRPSRPIVELEGECASCAGSTAR